MLFFIYGLALRQVFYMTNKCPVNRLLTYGTSICISICEAQASKASNAVSKKDAIDIHPYNDKPMVITVKRDEWEIKKSS